MKPEDTTTTAKDKNSITLDTPIIRGDQKINKLFLRKPMAGELRGLNLTDLIQMDVVALHKVLPRISDPTLTEAEVGAMDPADLLSCGSKVASFLL